MGKNFSILSEGFLNKAIPIPDVKKKKKTFM